MDFSITPELEETRRRIAAFVEERLLPLEADSASYDAHENISLEVLDRERAAAREAGLWCLQMPRELGGGGLHFYVALTSLAASMATNIGVAAYLVYGRLHHDRLKHQHFENHNILMALLLILSATNLDTLSLMPWDSANYGGFPTKRAALLSLVTVLLENIPQMAAQAGYAVSEQRLTLITLFSVTSSGFLALLHVTRKGVFVAFGSKVGIAPKMSVASVEQENATLRSENAQLKEENRKLKTDKT